MREIANDNRIDVYIRWLRRQRRALVRQTALLSLRPGYFLCDDCDQPHRDRARAEGGAGTGGGGRAEGGRRLNAATALEEIGRVRRNTAAIYSEEGEEEDEDDENEAPAGEEQEQENVPDELEEGYWPAVEDVYGI